jgi:hypothetical protein
MLNPPKSCWSRANAGLHGSARQVVEDGDGRRTATVAESTHAAQERALTARNGFDEIVYFIESCLGERVLESS